MLWASGNFSGWLVFQNWHPCLFRQVQANLNSFVGWWTAPSATSWIITCTEFLPNAWHCSKLLIYLTLPHCCKWLWSGYPMKWTSSHPHWKYRGQEITDHRWWVMKQGFRLGQYNLVTEYHCCYCSATKSYLTLCDPMDCSTPGFPVFHYLLEFIQTHVHWVGDAIQLSHLLSPPFSSCPQSFPASGSFPISWLFSTGDQSIGASAPVLPMNI